MTQAKVQDLLDEETSITELTIDPNGRVYVFGASREVLELLESLEPGNPRLATLLGAIRQSHTRTPSLRKRAKRVRP